MANLLESLTGKSKTIFLVAGLLLVFNAIGAGLVAFAGMAIGQTMKDIFQSAGYGLALVGGLALYPVLSRDSTWLARIAAGLASLGVLGGGVLTIAYLLHAIGVVTTVPGWIPPFGAGIGLGQLGLALFGVAALRSEAYSTAVGLSLIGPLLVFIFFIVGATFVGEEAVPAWVPFLTVCAQTVVHLAIAFSLPGEPVRSAGSGQQEASLEGT